MSKHVVVGIGGEDGPVRWDLRVWEVGLGWVGLGVSVVYDGIYFAEKESVELNYNG